MVDSGAVARYRQPSSALPCTFRIIKRGEGVLQSGVIAPHGSCLHIHNGKLLLFISEEQQQMAGTGKKTAC